MLSWVVRYGWFLSTNDMFFNELYDDREGARCPVKAEILQIYWDKHSWVSIDALIEYIDACRSPLSRRAWML